MNHCPLLRFGTFMTNNEKERDEEGIVLCTVSLWAHLDHIQNTFKNEDYVPNDQVHFIKL